MKSSMKLASVLVAAVMAAGCASSGKLGDAERLALYREHAGEPVGSFSLFGGISGWTPLGDSALAVWTRPSTAYLLDLHGSCMDLDFAHSIGLTSNLDRVHAGFDKVLVSGPSRMPCTIREIRPLDVKAVKASEKELREAKVQEREAAGAD